MDKFNTRRSEEQAYKALLLHTTRRMWLLLRESTGILEIFRTQSEVQLKDLFRDERLPKHVPVGLWKQQINRHLLQHIRVLAKTKLPPFWNSRSRDIHFSDRAKCPKILDILTSQIQPAPGPFVGGLDARIALGTRLPVGCPPLLLSSPQFPQCYSVQHGVEKVPPASNTGYKDRMNRI